MLNMGEWHCSANIPVRTLLSILLCLALATGVKAVWNIFYDSEDDPSEVFSRSASEAKRAGILQAHLLSEMSPGSDSSHLIHVSEAWVERCAVHRYSYVWLHERVPSDGYTVIIKLAESVDPRIALWPPEREASFTLVGGRYFIRHFDSLPTFPMVLDERHSRESSPVIILKEPNQ